MSPFAIAALGLLALAALVGWSWWRKWHRELAAARHTYRAAQEDVEAATVFYGSMQLDPALERHHVSGQNWRERTMVELAPEALDPGPGEPPPPLVAPGPAPELTALLGGVSPRESPLGRNAPTGQECVILPAPTSPASLAPVWERLADTGDIRDAALLADITTYMRDQDADVADWLAGRAITWARLEIGALT